MGNAGIIRELLRFARADTGKDPAYAALSWRERTQGFGIVMMAEAQRCVIVSGTCLFPGRVRHDG